MPVGSIIAFAGKNPPEGWLLCNGQQIADETKYVELRAVLGVNLVPNLSGRTLIGAGQGAGLTARPLYQQGGAETHKLAENELAEHHHFGWGESSANNWGPGGATGGLYKNPRGGGFTGSKSTDDDNYLYASTKTGESISFNIMQPFHVVNYIIKY